MSIRRGGPSFGVELVRELFEIFVVGARQQIEERVEAAIERAPQLWDRPVDGVERQTGRRAVSQRHLGVFELSHRSFGD